MATIKRFEDMEAWKLARTLCCEVGKLIDEHNFKNNYRLINQIEGSAGSIMDNIAEGFERGSRLEFIQYLGYSKASCAELRSQLYRALDRKYIDANQFEYFTSFACRISAMLYSFINYLQQTNIAGLRRKTPN